MKLRNIHEFENSLTNEGTIQEMIQSHDVLAWAEDHEDFEILIGHRPVLSRKDLSF